MNHIVSEVIEDAINKTDGDVQANLKDLLKELRSGNALIRNGVVYGIAEVSYQSEEYDCLQSNLDDHDVPRRASDVDEDYSIWGRVLRFKEQRADKEMDHFIQYEAANDPLVQLAANFGSPKWVSRYLAWKLKRKYKKYQNRMEWSRYIRENKVV